jgi:enamine deaminase RidA (YjgF/YER057c/UK114 family)
MPIFGVWLYKMNKLMRYWRVAILGVLSLAVAYGGKKKNPDDTTQTLDLPKDPPMVAVGEPRRLVFHVSPLSAKGLLSQQTREALKAILKANGGAPVVHIRAFVAGSGDLRRVPQIVSEVFTEKKLPLPSVSVVQAGSLPMENAQIVIETVSQLKKEVNVDGLVFVEAQPAASLEKSLDQLASRLGGAVALRVSCFVSAIGATDSITARFPSAAVDLVQTQRSPVRNEASCEAVGRGGNIRVAKLAFTGTQVAFGADEKAAKLAFQRIDRDLSEMGIEPADIVATNIYPLSVRIGELARQVQSTSGSVTVIPFEGIASVDGSFAIDAMATSR